MEKAVVKTEAQANIRDEIPAKYFKDGLPEIIPAKYDIVFKKVFLENEDLLEYLLRSIVDLPDEEYEELTVTCSEVLPDKRGGKKCALDIKVITKSKMVIDIEIQRGDVAHLRERIVFYISGLIKEQLLSGDEYDEIRRVIGMVITERGLIPEDAEYHHRFTLYDLKTGTTLTDLIEVHTLELSKLPMENDGSDMWRCLKLLNAETKEELDMIAEMSPELKKAADIMKAYSELDPKTRREYEMLALADMDDRVRLKAARKEGRAEGRVEGMADAARAMKAKGMDTDTIADVTGMTPNEIRRL